KVQEVTEGSGAAAAKLRAGDVILKLNGRVISGLLEMRNALEDIEPNAKVKIEMKRGGVARTLMAVLGNRPELPKFPNARLQAMEQMGTKASRVRSDFPSVIQSDMRPNPNQIGGPVVDLSGRVVGITLARADRTRSFIMPANAVVELLATEPLDPALAKSAAVADLGRRIGGLQPQRGGGPPPGIVPGNPDRMRRHVDDMQRLMDRMRDEMDRLEQQNR
ncbi:MAG: PDZ domain-containing protein, partial [Akkermansiaceae bacterium]|nr:PDZ domain-containing protein [Akkermansiaceae bacterium]